MTRPTVEAPLRQYDVTVTAGSDVWTATVSARSRNRAMLDRFYDIQECWPDVTWLRFKSMCRARLRPGPPPRGAYASVERRYGLRVEVGDRISTEGLIGTVVMPPTSTPHRVHFIAEGMHHALQSHPSSVVVLDPAG